MDNIKKCPFCGNDAELINMYEDVGSMGRTILARVVCDSCGASVKLTEKEFENLKKEFGFRGGYYHMHKELWDRIHNDTVSKWNRRA